MKTYFFKTHAYSRNANMGFHFWSLPTRSAFTKLQKAKVKQMHCTACHESRSLVLIGGTSATDVLREGRMCILWCLRDFRLTQHTDMDININLKLLATSWYTLCTYILSYSNQLLKLNFCLKYSMCIHNNFRTRHKPHAYFYISVECYLELKIRTKLSSSHHSVLKHNYCRFIEPLTQSYILPSSYSYHMQKCGM